MNVKVEFIKKLFKNNLKNLILGWGVIAFILAPASLMLTIKPPATTLTITTVFTSIIYWIIVFIICAWITKKNFQNSNNAKVIDADFKIN